MSCSLTGCFRSRPLLAQCFLLVALGEAVGTGGLRAQDCNHNGVADSDDLARGTSIDCDRDDIPDECKALFAGEKRNWTGPGPAYLAAADLNGDGHMDLVTANDIPVEGFGGISALLGNGDGKFQNELRSGWDPHSRSWSPRGLVAGNLDADGRIDLAIANSGVVSVLRGHGDGTFDAGVDFSLGEDVSPSVLIGADFNGDGLLDLATANDRSEGSDDVSILLGNADGTLKLMPGFEVGTRSLSRLIAADVNGDDRMDLITDHAVRLGNGDGTFQAEMEFADVFGPEAVLASDINGDGPVDIVTDRSILLGKGDGTFPPELHVSTRAPASLAVDIDGDSKVDLIRGSHLSDDVTVNLGNGDGTFQPERHFVAGKSPRAVIAADLDGDGRLDLAAANHDSSDISVLIGHGDGTFRARVRPTVGRSPQALFSTDVDGDGRVDIVTLNADFEGIEGDGDVSLLLGNGDGMFAPEKRVVVGERASVVFAEDIDGDGRGDLGIWTGLSNELTVLLGNGDGSFRHEGRFFVGFGPIVEIVSADLNGDRWLDLAAVHDDGDLSVLVGNGDGTFQSEVHSEAAIAVYSQLLAADLNGDGRNDLIALHDNGNAASHLSVLLGNGDGTFQSEVCSEVMVYGPPLRFIAGDFDSDGRVDIIIAGFDVVALFGTGDGRFEPEIRLGSFGPVLRSIIASDLNGDQRTDLAIAISFNGPSSVWVLLGNGDGTFKDAVDFETAPSTSDLIAADIDRDGRMDLVTANSDSNTVSVLFGDGRGNFSETLEERLTVGENIAAFLAADFNGDGRVDFAASKANPNAPHVPVGASVLLGNGDGTFQVEDRLIVAMDSESPKVATDINGDGRVDLIGQRSALVANGDGTFQPGMSFSSRAGESRVGIVAADFNGDDRVDLASVNWVYNDLDEFTGSDLSLLTGNGDGTFQPEAYFAVGSGYRYRLAASDLDGDGRVDLVAGNPDELQMWLGNGDGTFQDGVPLSVGGSALIAVDLTGDGLPDVATANSGHVSVLVGNGNGTFQPESRTAVGLEPDSVVAADLDGDTRVDLATAYSGDIDLRSDYVSVLLGNGDGTFRPEDRFAVGHSPTSLVAADIDGNGRMDLAVLSYQPMGKSLSSRTISVILNGRLDRTRPAIHRPGRLRLACASLDGAVGDFNVTATDDCDPSPVVTHDHPPGSFFPPGTTLVTATARDASGNESRCSFEVEVDCRNQVAGDCNQDGMLDISDAICLLGHLFLGVPAAMPCDGGAISDPGNMTLLDSNGDVRVDLSDAVRVLGYLFGGSGPPVLGARCVRIEGCPDNAASCKP